MLKQIGVQLEVVDLVITRDDLILPPEQSEKGPAGYPCRYNDVVNRDLVVATPDEERENDAAHREALCCARAIRTFAVCRPCRSDCQNQGSLTFVVVGGSSPRDSPRATSVSQRVLIARNLSAQDAALTRAWGARRSNA